MKSVLVTGGCGFLGSHIVHALAARGVEKIRVLALPGERTDNIEDVEARIVRGNVLDPDDCTKAVEGVDTVFHAAAIYKAIMPDPTPMYEVNLRGTFNVLAAARRAKVDKVVYTASIVAMGRPPVGQLGDETTPYEGWDVDFAYSRAKFLSRLTAEDFANWGLDVRIVCPGMVFGPGDVAPTPSGQLIINAVQGGPPIYVDGGASYVDVRDAAEVHVLAADKGKAGERYLATAHNLHNNELQTAIDRAIGRSRKYRKVPVPVARALITALEKQAAKKGEEPPIPRVFFEYSLKPNFYKNDKSVKELGATYRSLDESLRDAVAWFREKGMV